MTINYRHLFILLAWICTISITLYSFFHYLFPFAVSLLCAIIINPIVQALQDKLHLGRKLSVLTVLLLFLFSFITFITFSMVELIHLLQYLTKIMPKTIEHLFNEIEQFSENFIDRIYQIWSSFNTFEPDSKLILKEMIMETVDIFKNYSQQLLVNFLHHSLDSITNFLRASYFLLFILIGTFFISVDGPKWIKRITNHMVDPYKSYIKSTKINFVKLIKKYALAQLIIIFITGSLVYIGLTFIGIEHALAIAVVSMVLDLIPLIGISGLFIPWLIFLFLTHQYALTIKISILLIVLIVTRNIIEPKLIGSSIGIHPLALIIILFVFINFFGFIGFIIGPIFAVGIQALSHAGVFGELKNYLTKSN